MIFVCKETAVVFCRGGFYLEDFMLKFIWGGDYNFSIGVFVTGRDYPFSITMVMICIK